MFAADWFLGLFDAPLFPGCAPFVREQVDFFKSVLKGKILCALANQHDVTRPFHNCPGDGYRVHDAFDAPYTAGLVARAVHDASIKLNNASRVWCTAGAHRRIADMGFDRSYALFNRVQDRFAVL